MSKMQDIQDWLRKYLFWCLCGLIAIFSVTSWWLGVRTLNTKSKENLTKIQSNFDSATKITEVVVPGNIHPNDVVNKQLSDLTLRTRKTVLESWQGLYNRQKEKIFKWPVLLDKEFLDWINSNPADAEIPPDQLVEYQNKVLKELERIVTKVAYADWPDAVAAAAAAGTATGSPLSGFNRGTAEMPTGGAGGLTGPGVPGESEKLLWNPADITTYKNRYKWVQRPSSTEVRLAQEDLWILEQLCSVIAKVNGTTPPYQRPIKVVTKIAIEGFALDGAVNGQPKAINTQRVLRPGASTTTAAAPTEGAAAEAAPAADGATGEAAPTIGAAPTRLGISFTGAAGGGEAAPAPIPEGGAPAEGGAPVRKLEDDLLEWRYVDQKGYPLSKAQLDGDHKTDLYRMVPFKLQLHILQASLPKLLETIKNAPLTMEVTQIRINADRNAAAQFANQTRTLGGDGGQSQAGAGNYTNPVVGLLPGEIVLELHGVAYIATPYDDKKLPPPDGAATPDAT
jgi:hypothetical protein